MSTLSPEASSEEGPSIVADLPKVNKKPAKPFSQFRAEYIAQNDKIRGLIADLKDSLPPQAQNSADFRTLENEFPDIEPDDLIAPSNIDQGAGIREGLHNLHKKRADLISTQKNATNPDAVKKQIETLEKEVMALHTMSLSFTEERENTLREEARDPEAQANIFNAFKSSEQGQGCKDFDEMMQRANTTNGITFKFNGDDLTIRRTADGQREIRHSDPKVMVEAAALEGLNPIKILEGTSTAHAAEIIEECTKRNIQVSNAKTFVGTDTLLGKIAQAGKTSPNAMTFFDQMIKSTTPLEQGRLKEAALTNAMLFTNREFKNTDNRTTSKNEVFSDAPKAPKEDREVINILHVLNNGAKPDAIRQMIGGKSAKWIANFMKKAEQMIVTVNPTTHAREYKVPNGETPSKLIDLEQYMRDKVLVSDKGTTWDSVTKTDPTIGGRLPKEEAAAPGAGPANSGA